MTWSWNLKGGSKTSITLEPLFNIISSPFSAKADSAPEDTQEMLDLEADYDLKEKFKTFLLLEFYGCLSAAAFLH